MKQVVIYEVMLEDGSREVCFKCAVTRVENCDCMVHTYIQEYEDGEYPI